MIHTITHTHLVTFCVQQTLQMSAYVLGSEMMGARGQGKLPGSHNNIPTVYVHAESTGHSEAMALFKAQALLTRVEVPALEQPLHLEDALHSAILANLRDVVLAYGAHRE